METGPNTGTVACQLNLRVHYHYHHHHGAWTYTGAYFLHDLIPEKTTLSAEISHNYSSFCFVTVLLKNLLKTHSFIQSYYTT